MLRCRWTFQGLVWNELHGIQYPPFSCVAVGMPGASNAQIRQVVNRQQNQKRLFCEPTSLHLSILDRQTSH